MPLFMVTDISWILNTEIPYLQNNPLQWYDVCWIYMPYSRYIIMDKDQYYNKNKYWINRRNRIYVQIYNQTLWIPSTIVNKWMSGLKHLYNIDKCNMHCQIRRKSKWEINFAFIVVTYGYNISYEVCFSQVCDWMRLYLKRLILIRLKNWS